MFQTDINWMLQKAVSVSCCKVKTRHILYTWAGCGGMRSEGWRSWESREESSLTLLQKYFFKVKTFSSKITPLKEDVLSHTQTLTYTHRQKHANAYRQTQTHTYTHTHKHTHTNTPIRSYMHTNNHICTHARPPKHRKKYKQKPTYNDTLSKLAGSKYTKTQMCSISPFHKRTLIAPKHTLTRVNKNT